MTKEETIKSALKFLVHKQQEQGSWGYADNDNTNKVSWNEVLEWIDKQPCGDCISRQAAIDEIEWEEEYGRIDTSKAIDCLKKLPSVEQEKCGDCISRQVALEVLDDYAEDIESGNLGTAYSKARMSMCAAPSVEPERRTGKWIWEDGNIPYCSNCKKYSDDADMQDIHGEVHYCSHCGAKMEVDGDGI